jgi:hypothetical protein
MPGVLSETNSSPAASKVLRSRLSVTSVGSLRGPSNLLMTFSPTLDRTAILTDDDPRSFRAALACSLVIIIWSSSAAPAAPAQREKIVMMAAPSRFPFGGLILPIRRCL